MTRLQEALQADQHPSVEDLRKLEIFHDLSEEGLRWLASVLVRFDLKPDEVAIEEGTPAEFLTVLFEGEVRAERGNGPVYTARAGQVTGLLPYSRLTHYPRTVRAEVETRGALLHKNYFPEMLERMPELRGRLVTVLADRIRETVRADEQHQKLAALGKLAAGLAHELNNPAAAVRRATDGLRQAVSALRTVNRELEERGLDQEARVYLAEIDCNWLKSVGPPQALDSLERSEREDVLVDWLQQHGVTDPWELAATLIDTGASTDLLTEVASKVPADMLGFVLVRLANSFLVTRLIEEISGSTSRISEMIRAIKEYSYMDQAPEQEVDIHQGIENTLIMLKHRLKQGIEVVREYDNSIPKVTARGSELNQVWTNLIGNAIDAMNGNGRLAITTRREAREARVDVVDNGPGIPAEIQDRIFEPFFTTKPPGEGTGLGLDAVYRIVRTNRGRIDFESKPGETRFIVRLPLDNSALAV